MLPQTAFIFVENHSAKTALTKLFQFHGISPMIALSGRQALRRLKTTPPSIIVLDMQHPGFNEDLFYDFISANEASKQTKFILLSDANNMNMVDEEFNDYIFSRTVDIKNLAQIVQDFSTPYAQHRYN